MKRRLEGKVAVISGTGRGQGRVAAKIFAAEGAIVVGTGIDVEAGEATRQEVTDAGGQMTLVYPCDLSVEADVIRLIETTMSEFGRIDVVYNNAASAARRGVAEELSYDDFRYSIEQTLAAPWLTTKHAIPHMRQAGGGSVVNISSIAGMSGGLGTPNNSPAPFAYSVAKAALIRMTELLAVQLASAGIRVNCLSPGVVDTPRTQAVLGDAGSPLRQAMARQIPLGRPATSEEVVAAAVFLASDESSYITGHNLVVDGGWTASGGTGPADISRSDRSS